MSSQYVSEQDFVANYVLPKLKEASRVLKVADVVDFHIDTPIDGRADLTAEKVGKRLFVLEAKFKKKSGRIERDIEPRDPDVLNQAINYAALGGFPYYLTCNAKRIILFQLKSGTKAYESEIKSYQYEIHLNWAEEILKTTLELVPISLKRLDDSLVDILHEAFNDLYPEFLSSLKEMLKDKKFYDKYIDWLESQGIELSEENNRLIASQSTYLQINKLLFYQVIRVIYPNRLIPLKIREDEDVATALNEFYREARSIDYAPIYESDIISEIPFTIRAKERIRTLLDTLNEFDFSKMESDFIGRVYEKLIPPLERKRLGQFYTPPNIVDFIVQLTLKKPNAIVLDPGCGSGSFLVKAYHKLIELQGIPREVKGSLSERFHQELLKQIYGIDINQFPAHLSVINLAIQNPKSKINEVNIIVNDFFNIKSGQATLAGFESITPEGERTIVQIPPFFDTIVANPPYIRQELLGDKEKKRIKELVEGEYKNKVFVGTPPKKITDAIALNKQSDIYIYFFIHGVSLLRNNGSLGFISSNKWLEVEYGEPFQQFLLNTTRINYIVEFDRAIFPELEIDTAVTILQKEQDKNARNKNIVKFIRLKRALPINELVSKITSINENFEDNDIKLIVVRQEELKAGKWNTYLRAPPVFFKIIKNPKMKPLGELTKIYFGTKTGYDNYFIISKEKAREWGIEKEFLKPCAPAGEKIKGLILSPNEITEYFFWVDKPKEELKGTNALKYIEYGEKLEVEPKARRKDRPKLPNVKSVKGRKFWYDIPKLEIPSIFFPMWFRYKYRAFLNKANVHGHSYWNYIITKPKDAEIIATLLNSTVTQLLLEVFGRQYSGMLHTKVYELKLLPIIDPSEISSKQREKLSIAFRKLNNAVENRIKIQDKLTAFKSKLPSQQGLLEPEIRRELEEAIEKETTERMALDKIILDILGLIHEDYKKITDGLEYLRELRKMRTKGETS